MTLQQKAVELASAKINASPRQYELYISDKELFKMLVEDCKKQISVMECTTQCTIMLNLLNEYHKEVCFYEQSVI